MLEELVVSTKYSGFFGAEHILDLKGCGRLTAVKILTPMVFMDRTAPSLEYLTSLELLFCQSQLEVLRWLDSCPNLEILTVELYSAQASIPIKPCLITMPKLSSVSITCFYGDCDPSLLLDSLVLPNLFSFRLAMSDINRHVVQNRSWTKVKNLLERSSGPPLALISLPDTPMSPQDLIDTLRLARECRHVVLGGDAVSDEVLRCIAGDSQENRDCPLLPQLESLELYDISDFGVSTMALARSRACRSRGSREDKFDSLRHLLIGGKGFDVEGDRWPEGLQVTFDSY